MTAIERDDYAALGAPVFVRGHLKRYAALVGLPAGRFGWLTSRAQILRFDWNHLPAFTALVVAAGATFNGTCEMGQREDGKVVRLDTKKEGDSPVAESA